MKISKIVICEEHAAPGIDTGRVVQFLSDTFDVVVECGGDVSGHVGPGSVERTRILDLKRPFQLHPAAGQVKGRTAGFEAYDGFELQRVLRECMPAVSAETLCIVITDRLTCTFDADDFRYHARAVVCANPAIISTAGMVEAPARPRQYYLDVMASLSREDVDGVRERYRRRFLEHRDPRIPKVLEGYLLQAVVYHVTGDAFCHDAECRLHNSHWQEDLLRLQLETEHLCSRHEGILRQMQG